MLLDKSRRSNIEIVANNRNFAIDYMRNHGFEVMGDPMSEYPHKFNYFLRGELVGWSYDTFMILQPVMPSLVKMGILAQRRNTEIPFDLPGIDEVHDRLQDAVMELKNSLDSYDELVKKSRVQKVREYFKYRNIAKQGVKEYNKLMNQDASSQHANAP